MFDESIAIMAFWSERKSERKRDPLDD